MKFYNLGQFFYWIVMFKLPEKNCPSSQGTNRAEYNFDLFFSENWKNRQICKKKIIYARPKPF